jgi:hypothetical protein
VSLSRQPPQLVSAFSNLGEVMATLPNSDLGSRAPRLLLSVPTGQYVAWFLANGAILAPPKIGDEPQVGDRVTVWLDQKMQDLQIEQKSETDWIVRGDSARAGKIGVDRIPGVKLPDNVPEDRGQGRPSNAYRQRLSELPNMKNGYSVFYERQCYSPVVIIGDGAEYLSRQRQELIDEAPTWLDEQSRLLLDQDTLQVSNPDRILFHPFMIFSPRVGQNNPWLRSMVPRLVIVTRWSYYKRMDPTLFASSPMVILANRRVSDNWGAIDETSSEGDLPERFSGITLSDLPVGVYARKFSSRVDLPRDEDEEWEN